MQNRNECEVLKIKTRMNQIYWGTEQEIEEKHTKIYDDVRKRFETSFGEEPSHFIRVGGVLPLLGDTSGLGEGQAVYCATS